MSAFSFRGTLTSGIQDISALLPLLGTQQCETHIGSALTGGYLYSAGTALSIFGSLGIAKAAGSVLLACISYRWFVGARKLDDAGFTPDGKVSPMIALDKNNKNRFLAETKLMTMLEAKHIDNPENLSVDWDIRSWNISLFFTSCIAPVVGMAPYAYLLLANRANHNVLRSWIFPIFRVVGSFLCVILAQWALQIRILTILKRRVIFMSLDKIIREADAEETVRKFVKWDAQHRAAECLWSLKQHLLQVIPPSVGQKDRNRESPIVLEEGRAKSGSDGQEAIVSGIAGHDHNRNENSGGSVCI